MASNYDPRSNTRAASSSMLEAVQNRITAVTQWMKRALESKTATTVRNAPFQPEGADQADQDHPVWTAIEQAFIRCPSLAAFAIFAIMFALHFPVQHVWWPLALFATGPLYVGGVLLVMRQQWGHWRRFWPWMWHIAAWIAAADTFSSDLLAKLAVAELAALAVAWLVSRAQKPKRASAR